ncbi:MAG TPA: sigma-54 dependent transcriptional regulator [Longimicrobiaceae bacterium]|nr:sigma-54 dependent transcriptional regulator [Longimicrobiaceae bacterium]
MSRILVVDDEEGIREFIRDALTDEGHDCHEAGDVLGALHLLHQSTFDLLITDLKMPGALDGMDLVRKARSESPEMEVVVLSAHGTVQAAVEAMRLGAFDFLQKPIGGPSELRLLVSRALERKKLLTLKDQRERERESLPPLTYGDPVMTPVIKAIERVAPTNASVLLLGESGTGKEVAARTIHRLSRRADGPFIPVNCAAISESLMESEIFGHEKGAFTGATAARRGRIELAEGGTLFLDEIGELKLELQAKLLRVLQDRKFERVGGTRTIEADVRWVAATNRDLEALIGDGGFREDLYHRLAVFPIRLPPLRERPQDILPISEALLARASANLGRPPMRLDPRAIERISRAHWSGNVRELANSLERAAILADGDIVRGEDLDISFAPAAEATTSGRTMTDLEREAIKRALADVGGNRRLAAERLGIGVRTLYEKLKRYELE